MPTAISTWTSPWRASPASSSSTGAGERSRRTRGFRLHSGAGNVTAGDVNGDSVPDVYLNNALYLHLGATWVPAGTIPSGALGGYPDFETRSFDFDLDGDVDTLIASGYAYVDESGGAFSTHALATTSSFAVATGWTLAARRSRPGRRSRSARDRSGSDLRGNFPTPRPAARSLQHRAPPDPGRPGAAGPSPQHGPPRRHERRIGSSTPRQRPRRSRCRRSAPSSWTRRRSSNWARGLSRRGRPRSRSPCHLRLRAWSAPRSSSKHFSTRAPDRS